jgi:uncharacterized delta-60 repeat protein
MNFVHAKLDSLPPLFVQVTSPLCMRPAALGVLVLLPWSVVFAAPGELDPSFDGDGVVLTDFGATTERAVDTAIQSDGKIVAAGESGGDFALARYNPDGSLDISFGGDGKVTTDFGGVRDIADAVAIQSDGKIVAAGRFFPRPYSDDFALARYNSDGSLDTSFGVSGKVITNLGGADVIEDVAIQSDGKIVAAGFRLFPGWDFALARYNPDGSLDTSFGVNGVVITDFGSTDQAVAIAIQPDGKIVATGFSGAFQPVSDFAVARYNSDGSLDTSFDADGKVTTDFGDFDQARAMALQSDGKIVAAGFTFAAGTQDFALARYNPDGSLDTSFHFDGTVITDLGGGEAALDAMQLPDGKIVAAGVANVGGQDFSLVRYSPNGFLDTSFGVNGVVLTDIGGSDIAFALAVQPADGRYVAAGASESDTDSDFALARYFGDQSVIIDIKPGSERNPINLRSKGNTPVAILTSDTFDATQVNWESVRFGPSGATERHHRIHVTDVDGDGDMDAKLHFKTRDTGISCGDTEATLTGETFAGDAFSGADTIKTLKCPKQMRR